MAIAHQKNVATVAGGVTSVVVSAALGADPMAIGTWFFGAIDGLITRIQAGYALNRRAAMGYLPRHGALNGVTVSPVPGSLDVGRLRSRLEITGPVAFKRAIGAGQDTEQALRSMSTQMGGVADEYVRNGDRDVITGTALRGQGVVGWRRRLSGKSCGFCSMLASRGAVYTDRKTAVVAKDGLAFHPHCVPAGTLVSGPTVEKGFRRWYEGELVIIRTVGGDELAITPNHPVLTDRGWVPAGLLRVGDDVLRRAGLDGESLDVPDEDDVPTPIEQIWRPRGMDALTRMPVAAEDFHGDGVVGQGDVDVVGADGLFADVLNGALCEPHAELVRAGALAAGRSALATQCDLGLLLFGAVASADLVVEGSRQLSALRSAEPGHAEMASLAGAAAFYAGVLQPSGYDEAVHGQSPADAQLGLAGLIGSDGALVYRDAVGVAPAKLRPRFDPASAQCESDDLLAMADLGRRLRERLAGGIQRSGVVELRRVDFAGHVYNLQTVEGWYSAAGIIVSNCRCWAEPLYRHQQEPPEVQRLQRQWQRVTAGQSGNDKARAWRRHWEDKATPRARAREGIAARAGRPVLGAVPGPTTPIPIRPELVAARSPARVGQVFTAEARRITGRDIPAEFDGSVQTAREHAEGILRGLERFPEADLTRVEVGFVNDSRGAIYDMRRMTYAEADGGVIRFNAEWTSVEARQAYVDRLSRDGSSHWHQVGISNPAGMALHEFGHVVDIETIGEVARAEIKALVARQAAADGVTPAQLIAFDISRYARDGGARELAAEAFADVMLNGANASRLSREIYEVIERRYAAGGRVLTARGVLAPAGAEPLSAMTVPRLRALAAERGVTIPAGAKKADIVRLLDEGPGPTLAQTGRGASVLTPAQRAAVSRYGSNDLIPERINTRLRRGDSVTPEIARMDEAMAASRLEQDMVLFRGLNELLVEGYPSRGPGAIRRALGLPTDEPLPKNLVGHEFTELGFSSTATRRNVAEMFGTGDEGFLLEIRAPRGTHAVRMPGLEDEILLDRGLRLRVVGDRIDTEMVGLMRDEPFHTRVLTVEVVPAPVKKATPRVAKKAVPKVPPQRIAFGDAMNLASTDPDALVKLAADGRVTASVPRDMRLTATRIRQQAAIADLGDEQFAGIAPSRAAVNARARAEADRLDALANRIAAAQRGARKATPPKAPAPTVAQLRAQATREGITFLPPKATKAQLQEALAMSPAQRQAAAGKALRDAARERNRLIESRTSTAKLLAEVDELIANKASKATILQRLDAKQVGPDGLFAGADPAVVALLRDAVDDPTKLRAAVTRGGTKVKVKPIGKSGQKVKFDPDRMEGVGGIAIPDGVQVTVVTRGSTLTLPDGTVVQLAKAQVTPVVKPVKATASPAVRTVSGKDLTRRLDYGELDALPYVSGAGDSQLAQIWARQGFDRPPRVVTDAEWQRLIDQGGTPIYRGVRGWKDGPSADEIVDMYATGNHYPGVGVFGNGSYFTTSVKTARKYGTNEAFGPLTFNRGPAAFSGHATIEAILLPGARVISWDDLEKIRERLGIPDGFTGVTDPRLLVLGDPGRLASALGYDAIRIPTGTGTGDYGDEILVLNRTATAVRRR